MALAIPQTTKTEWLAKSAALALIAGAGVAVWGVFVEPRMLHKRSIHASIPRLPRGWQGERLAVLGDLQIGAPLANVDTVRRAVHGAIAAQPAAVLLTGDYVYNAAHDASAVIEQVVDALRPLTAAGLATFAVLGNHDFAPESTEDPRRQHDMADQVERALESIGVRVLRNEAAPLQDRDGEALYVLGLGEHAFGQDHWPAAFAHVPGDAPRVVLAHDPQAIREVPGGLAPLAVAGHTHGGQIRVPGTRELAPARWSMPWPEYVDGWIDGFLQPGNRLYVNRGIGFSRLPMRIGAPPELTVITLER